MDYILPFLLLFELIPRSDFLDYRKNQNHICFTSQRLAWILPVFVKDLLEISRCATKSILVIVRLLTGQTSWIGWVEILKVSTLTYIWRFISLNVIEDAGVLWFKGLAGADSRHIVTVYASSRLLVGISVFINLPWRQVTTRAGIFTDKYSAVNVLNGVPCGHLMGHFHCPGLLALILFSSYKARYNILRSCTCSKRPSIWS